MNTDLVRYQKSSTISVLKFNRISQNNCNVSQTESEISLNSIKKESKNNGNQNPSHSFRNIDSSQTYFRRTNTYFNNVEQDDQRIDEFNEYSGRQFTYTQDSAFAQPNSRRFELNLVSQAIKIQPIDVENTSKQDETTSKRQRSKWVDENSQQSPSISQKTPSKILSQSEMKNSTDCFGILMENMNKSLFELKQFRNQIEKLENEALVQKQAPKQIPKQEIIQIQEKKPLINSQKTQSNYYLPKQKSIVLKQEQQKQTAQIQQRNKSRAKSHTGIVVELREQVNAQFNRTPERQPNYKSITPVRQIIKCVELSDNRNDKLFSVQYRLKTGKIINVTMRRHDNLIKVAQDAAQKHKLEQNGYLLLLKLLKDKYRTILENQHQ